MTRATPLDTVFHALGDPTRRAILAHLTTGERSTGVLAAEFPLSRPTISKHLGVLKGAGLVRRRQAGRHQMYSLEPAPLAAAHAWLEHYERFWRLSLDGLKRHLEDEP